MGKLTIGPEPPVNPGIGDEWIDTKERVRRIFGDLGGWIMSVTVISIPPDNMCRVNNLYVNPQTGEFVIEYEDTVMKIQT